MPDTDLMLLASHTHNGPALPDGLHPYISYNLTDTTVIDAYGVWQRVTVVQLVRDVLAGDRTPVTLDYRVASQSWSSQQGWPVYRETAVPVLVRGADGDPVVVLYSYGCHSVAAGQQDEWYCDYPVVASAVIEDAYPGAMALFIPGPAGDQNPPGPFSWSQAERRLASSSATRS